MLSHLLNIGYVYLDGVSIPVFDYTLYCPATTEWDYYVRDLYERNHVGKVKYRVLRKNTSFLLKYHFKYDHNISRRISLKSY